ncbi:MAG: hypothetical protein FWD38_06570 [Oscillospiraceae bacterium]|nr:hypothetical protein [Oscillospiraceae bacterium]
MRRKELIISILLHSLFIVSVYVFQGVIFPHMRILGLVPLLLPIACTGVALYEGRYYGGITGLFAGILCDVSFNQPVGIFTVFLTLTGLVVGTMAETVILRGFVTYYICCAFVLAGSAFIGMFPHFFITQVQSVPIQEIIPENQSIPVQALITTAVQQTIYSLILALPIWFFVRALGNRTDRISPSGRMY